MPHLVRTLLDRVTLLVEVALGGTVLGPHRCMVLKWHRSLVLLHHLNCLVLLVENSHCGLWR